MHLLSFHDWIRRIYATRDDELDCNQVFKVLDQYVDTVVAEKEIPPNFSPVEHHLRQCPYCYDLYLAMRDAALLESEQNAQKEIVLETCETC